MYLLVTIPETVENTRFKADVENIVEMLITICIEIMEQDYVNLFFKRKSSNHTRNSTIPKGKRQLFVTFMN